MTLRSPLLRGASAAAVVLVAQRAVAQTPVKSDGVWRATIGLAASYASGNTDSSSFSLNADAVRATARNRTSGYARAVYGKTDDTTTADLLGLGGRYELNVSARSFTFGQFDFLRDKPANLQSRFSAAGGLGYKLVDNAQDKFSVFGGLGYTYDRYFSATIVADELRSSYSHPEANLGEESIHQLTPTTNFKQKLVLYPDLSKTGEYRALFDAAISVAINRTMDLTAGLNFRYNSDPGSGLKKSDTLFLTGLTVKFY